MIFTEKIKTKFSSKKNLKTDISEIESLLALVSIIDAKTQNKSLNTIFDELDLIVMILKESLEICQVILNKKSLLDF